MNYKKIYDDLIDRAKSENRRKTKINQDNFVYYERHHIFPKCLGGLNNKENLVLLTGKEHFVAHKLLVEIYPHSRGMIHSIWMMSNSDNKGNRHYRVGAREYERVRREKATITSELRIGIGFSDEVKNNMRKSALNKPPVTRETKEKMREAALNKPDVTKETKDTMKKSWTNRISQICPWCQFEGRGNGMQRFHFDNCKQNPDYICKEELLCPWCGFEGINKGIMKLSHFDNCKQNPNYIPKERPEIVCPYCGKIGNSIAIMHRWHFENCYLVSTKTRDDQSVKYSGRIVSDLSKLKKSETQKNKPPATCPHCGFEGKMNGSMKRWHFDNCKLNESKITILLR